MNIYAIRDKLINYFLTPFAAPNDAEVLSAIAQQVNGEQKSAIAQAPHHFEIWRIGKVKDDGYIVPEKELVADATSLIRTGIRTKSEGEPAGRASQAAQDERTGEISRFGKGPGTYPSPLSSSGPTGRLPSEDAHPPPGRGDQGRN